MSHPFHSLQQAAQFSQSLEILIVIACSRYLNILTIKWIDLRRRLILWKKMIDGYWNVLGILKMFRSYQDDSMHDSCKWKATAVMWRNTEHYTVMAIALVFTQNRIFSSIFYVVDNIQMHCILSLFLSPYLSISFFLCAYFTRRKYNWELQAQQNAYESLFASQNISYAFAFAINNPVINERYNSFNHKEQEQVRNK